MQPLKAHHVFGTTSFWNQLKQLASMTLHSSSRQNTTIAMKCLQSRGHNSTLEKKYSDTEFSKEDLSKVRNITSTRFMSKCNSPSAADPELRLCMDGIVKSSQGNQDMQGMSDGNRCCNLNPFIDTRSQG